MQNNSKIESKDVRDRKSFLTLQARVLLLEQQVENLTRYIEREKIIGKMLKDEVENVK